MQRVRILSVSAALVLGLLVFAAMRGGPGTWLSARDPDRADSGPDDVDWGGAARKSRAGRYIGSRPGGVSSGKGSGGAADEGPVGKRSREKRSAGGGLGPRASALAGDALSRREWRGESGEWISGDSELQVETRDALVGGALAPRSREQPNEPEPQDEDPPERVEDPVFAVPLNRDALASDSTPPLFQQNLTFPEDEDGARFAADSVLAFPDAGHLRGEGGTLSLEVEPDWDGNDPGDFSLLNVRTANDPNNVLRVYKNGRYLRYIFTDNTAQEREIGFDMSDWEAGERHEVAVTWGDSTTVLYVDGRAVGRNSYGGRLEIPSGTPMYIGSDIPEAPLSGAGAVISDLRVYGKALNGRQIANAR